MQVRPKTNNNIHTIAPTISMATLVAGNKMLARHKLGLTLTSKLTRLALINDQNFFVNSFKLSLNWQVGIEFMAQRDEGKLPTSGTLRTAIFTGITIRDTRS